MIERLSVRSLFLLLSLGFLAGPLQSAETFPGSGEQAVLATNSLPVIQPGPVDGQIAAVTAQMLQRYHYLRRPFDETVSGTFFDRYLETLDPMHLHFTQADVAEFEHYRTNLSRLTLDMRRRGVADTTPACEVFNRFLERIAQRVAYADDLLKHEKFAFNDDERIAVNRKEKPYPADLNEARKLWRERLRFEYLQELLGKINARKKNQSAALKKTLAPKTNTVAKAIEPGKQTAVTAVVTPSIPSPAIATPPVWKERRQPILLSPKDTDRAIALQTIAAKARALAKLEWAAEQQRLAEQQAHAAAEAKKVEQERQRRTQVAAGMTNQPAVMLPKKTDEQEIVETLSHRYHRNLRFFTDWNHDDVIQVYLTALARVYDPHSDYLGHAQLEQFSIAMNLSLFGIGAELQSEDGYCKIHRLLPGGPAIKSKLIKIDDRIVAVAQSNQPPVDIVDMSLNKAVQLIRGPKGTEVRLTIVSSGAESATPSVVSLIRDEIPLIEQAAKAKIIELPDVRGQSIRLGVIDLPSFYATFDTSASKDKPGPKSTTADVAALLEKLKEENVAGVILDLRNNGGGSLEEAVRLTGLFVKTNPVVQVRETDGLVQEANDNDPAVAYDGPLVVLTSRHSASASEIVAGALQDYGRALIVGDVSTHGKGTVQSVNSLRPFIHYPEQSPTNDPGALKLTIKKFFRPSGMSTQLKGVVPDIVLPSVANESKDIGESALDNPLSWDTIPSAQYDHFNLVEPYLPDLRRRSTERVSSDKDFAYVREDIELFKKLQADKTISLNQERRLKEQSEAEARQKARDRERLARRQPVEKVYELTLQQAAQPGLPPPVAKTNAVAAASAPSGASSAQNEDNAEEIGTENAAAPDAPLLEVEHILMDYISQLPKGNQLTAGR